MPSHLQVTESSLDWRSNHLGDADYDLDDDDDLDAENFDDEDDDNFDDEDDEDDED